MSNESSATDGFQATSPVQQWTWLSIALITGGIVALLPSPEGLSPTAQRLAAVTAVMSILWVAQPVSVVVTSLIPLVAYPCLGILEAGKVSRAYSDPNVHLFLGGFLIAAAIERWGLHQRMALHVVSRLGGKPWQIMVGFIVATGLLSMWISNSAATMLMTPIALALLVTLRQTLDPSGTDPATKKAMDDLAIPVLLGVTYAASCGGMTTIVGTPTNMSFRGFWGRTFAVEPHNYPSLSMAEWMVAFVPLGIIMLTFIGVVMATRLPRLPQSERLSRQFFREALHRLGPASAAERTVMAVFAATAVLWILSNPLQFGDEPILPSWPSLVARGVALLGMDAQYLTVMVDDSTVAIGMAALLFLLPGVPENGKATRILNWDYAERAMPWGTIILVGSGFAMADAFKETRLADWIGVRLATELTGQPVWVLVGGVCLIVTVLTELMTNVAVVNAILPTLGAMAIQMDIDPRLLLIPATLTASCSFMLPVGTPPNAIVFGTGRVPLRSMASYGLLLDLFGVVAVTTVTLLWMPRVMDIKW